MNRILVIDDDESFRQVIVTSLSKHGFETLEAGGGGEGVKIARNSEPVAILCDMHMAGADGLLTLYALRRDKKIGSTPFILMSGHPIMTTKLPGTERGADGILAKPFTDEELLKAIQSALNGPTETGVDTSAQFAELRKAITGSDGMAEPFKQILDATAFIEKSQRHLNPGQLIDLVNDIHQATRRLQRSVDNCRLWARLDQIESDREKLAELQSQTANVRAVIEPMAREKAQWLGRSSDLTLHFVEGVAAMSEELLEKLVGEILDNALRYSVPGSNVGLSINRYGDEWVISIRDRGCGVAPDQLKRSVSPPTLDEVMNRRQGRGLGLAIARRVIDLHRGELSIYNQEGGGTEVIAMIPVAREGITEVSPSLHGALPA